jgi:hypothetical protein
MGLTRPRPKQTVETPGAETVLSEARDRVSELSDKRARRSAFIFGPAAEPLEESRQS